MKSKFIFLLLLIGIVLVFFTVYHISRIELVEELRHYSYSQSREAYGSLEKIKSRFNIDSYIYGGTVSHHLLAGIDIAQFYASFKGKNIDTVILIGPNHEGYGSNNISISNIDYDTPWGDVRIDREAVNSLIIDKVVNIDEEIFTGEHSISSEVPYIRFYIPRAKIVPIIIKRQTSEEELLKLVDSIYKIIDKNMVVIASVDFSHHTTRIIAQEHDDKSIETMLNFNFKDLSSLDLDSPNTVFVLLKYLQRVNAQKMIYWRQNSADILDSPDYKDVTSYIFSLFTK